MGDGLPFEDGVLLTGTLTVVVRRADGRPCEGRRVVIRGCGFV